MITAASSSSSLSANLPGSGGHALVGKRGHEPANRMAARPDRSSPPSPRSAAAEAPPPAAWDRIHPKTAPLRSGVEVAWLSSSSQSGRHRVVRPLVRPRGLQSSHPLLPASCCHRPLLLLRARHAAGPRRRAAARIGGGGGPARPQLAAPMCPLATPTWEQRC